MDTRKIICPCCGKEVDIPVYACDRFFDFNYTILINSTSEFFDLVDMCPECGYTMLFDNGITDEMKAYVKSDVYQNVLQDPNLEFGLKKWMLVAFMSEFDNNFMEAGIEYMKAYDYMELKGLPLDKRFIERAASCFLREAKRETSFPAYFLAVDCMRRDGEFEEAQKWLDLVLENFEGELVDKVSKNEKLLISLKMADKDYIDM